MMACRSWMFVGLLIGDAFGGQLSVKFPTDCSSLKDGVHYVKPTEDGPVMPAMCNNGYTIIDLSLDFDSISSYFTSIYQTYEKIDGYYIYGGDCDVSSDESSWYDWWTPATDNTKFTISRDCMSCQQSASYGDSTAYYMTAYYFCLNKHHSNVCNKYDLSKGENLFAKDLSYNIDDVSNSMCNICDDTNGNPLEWTDCMSLQLDASTKTAIDHDSCAKKDKLITKPSINDQGINCVCYKQDKKSSSYNTVFYESEEQLHKQILPSIPENKRVQYEQNHILIDKQIQWRSNIVEEDQNCHNKKFYISQKDFEQGTLRILECGTYVLTEDILIHFSKPSDENLNDPDWSPNDWNVDQFPWYAPTTMKDYYDGASDFKGVYHAGYFTGIAIETDHVVIDLNGYTLEMDPIYYLQQRFFSLIELGNKPFVGDQGPENFGRMAFKSVNNVVIKNGIIGLSSHQGIHGNAASNVKIHDIKVKNFDVSGIQCNGCQYLEIVDTVVGPQNSDIPVVGKYAHARALMPKLKYIAENYYDEKVTFNNERTVTMGQLVDEMVSQMDMIYNYVIHKIEPDENESDRWEAAKKIFFNPTGYQDGGSSYGIVLNGVGTAVVQFGKRISNAEHISLENVEIYGIQNSALERMWSRANSERQFQGFFFDPLDWMSILETEDKDRFFHYNGDVYHDLVFATQHIAMNDEFCLLNTINLSDLLDWVFNNKLDILDAVEWNCGSDVQSHDAKGVMGLRMDGQQGVTIKNVNIHDINNYGVLGIKDDYLCTDSYDAIAFLKAKNTIEPGYTGTRAHGFIATYSSITSIDGLEISSIKSQYGTAIGASIYQGSKLLSINNNANINEIYAGWGLNNEDVNKLTLPNYKPRACSFEIGNTDTKNEKVIVNYDNINNDKIMGDNIFGYDICKEDKRIGSMKVVKKDLIVGNNEMLVDEAHKETGVEPNGKNEWKVILIVVAGVVVIVGLLYSMMQCWQCIRDGLCKNSKNSENKGEVTPLLAQNGVRVVAV